MPTQPLSLQLVIRGGYKTADTTIVPEIWVNTLRMAVMLGSLGDPVATIPSQFEVVDATLSDSDTGWTGSSSWRLEGGINDFDPLSYLVDRAMPAVLAWQALTGKSNSAIVNRLDLYAIDTTGHAVAPAGFGAPVPASIIWDTDAGPAGGSSGNYLPLQSSCVASHRTPFQGRKGRGRMFLAGLVQSTVDSFGQFTSSFVSNALAKQVTFLEDLTIDDEAVSVRPALIPDFTKWAFITEARVGTVPDTQRRRRRQLTEAYSSDPVT